MFTSTTASRVRDLCREAQLSSCGRPRNHAIVQIRARVRNNGNMNLNLAAIRLIGLIAHKSKVSFRCKVIVYIYIYIYIYIYNIFKVLLVTHGKRRNPVSLPARICPEI